MTPKRRVIVPAFVLGAAVLLAAGAYLFSFASAALRFWGAGETPAVLLAAAFAALCLFAVVYRPIPVKFTAVAVFHLLAFGLLFDLLGRAAAWIWPKSAHLFALNGSGVPALRFPAGMGRNCTRVRSAAASYVAPTGM